ncbi:hypothetical protein BD414DRAFT_547547, partial [Trametes punicea]
EDPERLEPQAESEIEDVSKLLDSLPLAHARQDLEDLTKKIVEGKVVSLERQRHENNAHIVVVHATMVKTVYHVRFLTRIPKGSEKDLEKRMNVIFDHMVGTIREFGKFSHTYAYHACWQRTYKVLFAHMHKQKLEQFNRSFQQHREDLDEMRKTLNQMQLFTVLTNTESILKRLQVVDPDVEKAETFIRQNGGADKVRQVSNGQECLMMQPGRQDPELVERVAAILQEKATLGMKETLRQGFDELLEKHTERYLKKLESVQDAVIASVSASQMSILSRLSEGPHTLIQDEEIRAIWERESRWKSCVKCRIFIEDRKGLHEHYQAIFHEHGAHKDAWTLEFFSRVMYHSAIGDVIDEDGSGYLSASEVNDFISEQRCLAHWTNPEWFALYYRQIKHILQQLEESLHSGDAPERDRGSLNLVLLIVNSLKPLVLAPDVEDFSGIVKVPHQLRRLQQEYKSYEREKIVSNLKHFGDHVADRSTLNSVVGDTRIELHMLPLLHVLVTRLQDTVVKITSSKRVQNESLITVEELATSCIAVFVAFEDRMRDLVRGWRCEGKDVSMQVDRYADGLFRKLYRDTHLYERPYEVLRDCMFGENLTLPRHLRPFGSPRRLQTSVDGLVRDVAGLSERVQALENRVGKTQGQQDLEKAGLEAQSVLDDATQLESPPAGQLEIHPALPMWRRFVLHLRRLLRA